MRNEQAMRMIPYGHQDIREEDIQEVINVLNSDFITQGPTVAAFEKAVSDYVTSEHAVAVSNGTAALHLACLALELGPGDILWTSPISFVASANCGLYCGAQVDFVDISPTSMNMDVDALRDKLALAEKHGKLPKIIVVVHFAGRPCDMAAIKELADHYQIKIIEDACHAIGSDYRDSKTGSCHYSDITVFSFHPVKIITTGEGGMLTTNDEEIHRKATLLRSHGISREDFTQKSELDGDWYYEQSELGYNYRLTDIQSALGISQLKRINGYIDRRRQLARDYNAALEHLPLVTPEFHETEVSAWHLYVVQLDDSINRTQIYSKMKEYNIGVNVHYIPIHTQPYYRKLGFRPGDFPKAENYYARALTLPLYPGLEQQEYIVECLEKCLS